MKILFFIDSLRAGGKERQLVQIIKGLISNKKYEIVLVLMSQDVFYTEIHNCGIKIEYVIRTRKRDIKVFFKLYKICKKYKPNFIHTWDLVTSFYALPIAKILKINMINGSIRHGIRLNKPSHKFRTFIAKISPFVIANSVAGLKANNLKKDNRHFVLYNGIDDKFKKKKLKEDFENKNYIKFISVSSLTPYKDYFTVLKALKKMKNEGYKFLYFIIGDGPLKNEINSFIISHNMENYIYLLGQKKNIEYYMSKSDIFIHSSRGEGCSNVILEAMYSGLPIIATDTGGTKEIVTSANGILFEYKNSDDLFVKLKYLVDNPDIRKIFSENSFNIIEKKFTTEIMIKNYIDILNRILNR